MDSKFTKVMRPKFTDKPLSLKGPARSIVKPSAGLKSSSQAGIEAESFVVQDLKDRNCEILKQRFKTPFAEVDLIVRNKKSQIVLVEVKTLSKWDWIESRITQKQILRLKRAAIFLEKHYGNSLILCAAFVAGKKIYYVVLD